MHGDLCKHLGIDSSTDHPDRFSNLFLNAYINRHVHADYLKMIQFYSPFPVYEVPAIRVNTSNSTYTFTSVIMEMVKIYLILLLNIFRLEMAIQKKDEKVR